MPTTLDTLQIQVRTQADSAVKALDKLINTLDRLNGALRGVKVGNFVSELAKISQAAKYSSQLASIGNALKTFKGAQKIRISPTLASDIERIADASGRAGDSTNLRNLGSSLRSFTGLTNITIDAGLARAISDIAQAAGKIGDVSRLAVFAEALKSLKGLGRISIDSTLAGKLTEIANAARSLDAINKLESLARALAALAAVGPVSISSALGKNLSTLAAGLHDMDGVDISLLQKVAASLRSFEGLTTPHLGSFVNSLIKLVDAVGQLSAADFDLIIDRFNRMGGSLGSLISAAANGGDALRNVVRVVDQSNRYLSSTRGGGLLRFFQSAARMLTARFLGNDFLFDAVDKSNKYVEDMNLFTASLGRYANSARNYAQQVAEVMGIDPAQWMRNQGIFNTLITGFGVSAQKAALMSQNLTQLAYDLSSFYNIKVDGEGGAMQKIQAAVSGELEPIRRLGYDLSYTTLQLYANELGVRKNVTAMTQAEKVQLRYYALMKQVTVVQGDMSRTLESPANQIRLVQAGFEQAARAIGNIFIPIINKVLPWLLALAKGIRLVAESIASFFGFHLPQVDYSSITGATNQIAEDMQDANQAAGSMKNTLADFDELNVITSASGGSGGGAGGLGDGFSFDLPSYDFIGDAVKAQTDALLETIKSWWDTLAPQLLATAAAFVGYFAGPAITNFTKSIKDLRDISNVGLSIGLSIAGVILGTSTVNDILTGDVNWGTLVNGVGALALDGLGAYKLIKDLKLDNQGVLTFSLAAVLAGLSITLGGITKQIDDGGTTWESLITQAIGTLISTAGAGFMLHKLADAEKGGGLLLGMGLTLTITSLTAAFDDNMKVGSLQAGWQNVLASVMGIAGTAFGAAVTAKGLSKVLGKDLSTGKSFMVGIGISLVLNAAEMFLGTIDNIKTEGITTEKILALVGEGIAITAGVALTAAGLGLAGAPLIALTILTAAVFTIGSFILLSGVNEQVAASNAFAQAASNGTFKVEDVLSAFQNEFDSRTENASLVLSFGVTLAGNDADINSAAAQVNRLWSAMMGEGPDDNGKYPIENVLEAWQELIELLTVKNQNLDNAVLAGLTMATNSFMETLRADAAEARDLWDEMTTGLSGAELESWQKAQRIMRQMSEGTASSEDMDWLDQYRLITAMTDEQISANRRWSDIVNSDGVFTMNWDAQNGAQEIADYMDDVYDIYTEGLERIAEAQEKYSGTGGFIDQQLDRAYRQFDLGQLSEEQYQRQIEYWGRIRTLYDNAVQADVDRMTEQYQQAIMAPLYQVISGIEGLGGQQAYVYYNSFIQPLIKKMQDNPTLQQDSDFMSQLTAFDSTLYGYLYNNRGSISAFSLADVTGNDDLSFLTGELASLQEQYETLRATIENPVEGADVTGYIASVNRIIASMNRLGAAKAQIDPNFTWNNIPQIPAYANGGFVDDGQLFVAREAGAEMVGSIGGHTAVANNDQIVEGIEAGVTNANADVVSVLGDILTVLSRGSDNTGGTPQPSAQFGKFVKRSLEMYAGVSG